MPPLDDEIRRATDRAAASVRTRGVYDRVVRRKRRLAIRQRAATGMLALTVIAGTVLSTSLLNRTFQPASASGFVAFTRFLRGCDEHPNVRGTRDVFAVDVATGEERRSSHVDVWPDGSSRYEEQPDFSPDGRSFAWVDHYRHDLFVTDVRTGDTRKLTSGLSVGRPQFSPDGTMILFSSGGEGTPLTDEDFEGRDEFEVVEGETGEIRVVELDGSEPITLTNVRLATWTSDGRIAFARSGSVRHWQRTDRDSWTSTTTTLPTEFFVMNADGSNIERVFEYDGVVRINDAEWSPDGRLVAAEVVEHGQSDIYVLDLETRIPMRLTHSPDTDASPTWSPDGSYIAFHTRRWGDFTGRSEIAMVPSTGGDVIRLTHDACFQDDNPTWIADGSAVAALPVWTIPPLPDLGPRGVADPGDILVQGATDGVGDLFALDPVTADVTNITADRADQLSPAWSPDRTRIAFSSDAAEPGNLDIHVMDADGRNVRRLTTHPEGESRPAWSPDGSQIAFEGPGGVWVVNADGSNAHRVTDAAPGGHHPAWSPDGELIAFADADVMVVAPDGSGLRTLVETRAERPGSYYELEWSPDGSELLFTCERDICVVNADGSDLRNLTAGPDDTYERDADWSPDGTEIVFASDGAGGLVARLYVMSADGGNVRPLASDPRLGCCPDPDW
jgi:Tol biopolymer transport system component